MLELHFNGLVALKQVKAKPAAQEHHQEGYNDKVNILAKCNKLNFQDL